SLRCRRKARTSGPARLVAAGTGDISIAGHDLTVANPLVFGSGEPFPFADLKRFGELFSFSRVRLFVREAKRKVRIFSVSCRSAMNFVRESPFCVSHEKFRKCLAQRICNEAQHRLDELDRLTDALGPTSGLCTEARYSISSSARCKNRRR